MSEQITDGTVEHEVDVPEATDETETTEPEQTEPAEPDTFPRKVVEDLRRENATYRTRAQRADDLAARLHTALVAATGRLADPSDLPFEESHLDDADALSAAIDDLLSRKPHLASRKPHGDVGQGASASGGTVDLAGILRARAS
jgi:hypothetical protein